jgi:ClpX C4-type zinc finger
MGRLSNLARNRWRLWSGLRCSFCGRRSDSVGRLVAGASAHICDECITKCVAVLEQHGGFTPASQSGGRSR